jgi:hypothetical protein
MAVRILFLLTQDLDSPSGQGRYLPLAQGLARLGHAVHIAALHADFASLTTTSAEEGGVQVEYVAPIVQMAKGFGLPTIEAAGLVPEDRVASPNVTPKALASAICDALARRSSTPSATPQEDKNADWDHLVTLLERVAEAT